jgi:hypothetical protein
MIDIVSVNDDLGLFDTDISKAKNILSTQLGALEYLPDFGIDLKYFLDERVSFQNESFKAYLINVLAQNQINVTSVDDIVESLFSQYLFNITTATQSGGLVAR